MQVTHSLKMNRTNGDKLWIRADWTQPSSPIRYSCDGEEFRNTPFQVAGNYYPNIFRKVWNWLERGNA